MQPRLGRVLAAVAIGATLAGCAGDAPGSPAATASPTTTSSAPATPIPSPTARARPTPTPAPPADVGLEIVAERLAAPVGLVTAPGENDRAFVLEQAGRILVLRDGAIAPEPFLDLRDLVVPLMPDYDERGLLGLAFHPGFPADPRLFVYYGAPVRRGAAAGQDHTNTLAEYRLDPANPDRADPASARILLQFEQPQPNHSGGGLAFGPDGRLYLGTGDGGGEGDASEGHSPQGNAQDPAKLNGKILRLDVDGAGKARPTPEIHALGFRNPWRLTFEPDGDRRLLVSDVGYGRYEELDVVRAGGNYGWRIREGAHCLDLARPLDDVTGCATTDAAGQPLVDPVLEYTHADVGIAIVGGYVYRGAAIPALRGQYVFADFSADWKGRPVPRPTLLVATPSPGDGPWPWRRLVVDEPFSRFVSGMGEGPDHELYLLVRGGIGPGGTDGEIRRLVAPSG